jgi:hypothetical protein
MLVVRIIKYIYEMKMKMIKNKIYLFSINHFLIKKNSMEMGFKIMFHMS